MGKAFQSHSHSTENRRANKCSPFGEGNDFLEKEFLYVGHYFDINGDFILKIGTTNDLKRRAAEHTRNYKRTKNLTMPKDSKFVYDWFIPLSKYNTLRYEDKNRKAWQDEGIGTFIRNDRFKCDKKPQKVIVKIRKSYEIIL